jgi:flagellar motility protein MotE (MotC chaperone)
MILSVTNNETEILINMNDSETLQNFDFGEDQQVEYFPDSFDLSRILTSKSEATDVQENMAEIARQQPTRINRNRKKITDETEDENERRLQILRRIRRKQAQIAEYCRQLQLLEEKAAKTSQDLQNMGALKNLIVSQQTTLANLEWILTIPV